MVSEVAGTIFGGAPVLDELSSDGKRMHLDRKIKRELSRPPNLLHRERLDYPMVSPGFLTGRVYRERTKHVQHLQLGTKGPFKALVAAQNAAKQKKQQQIQTGKK